MRVPPSAMINGSPRSFGTRDNRIRIFDEYGLDWVGLITPEILESLKAGEYIWKDCYIPFRGAGEAYAGEAVTINDLRIDIYPQWMKKDINIPEWRKWEEVEKNFRSLSSSGGWNYIFGLGELSKHTKEFREKRGEFNRLTLLAKQVR
ncbi:MAG: hypothetical protein ABIG99_02925 [Patescibacteria group bacterium]